MLETFKAHITPFGKDRTIRIWLPDEMETEEAAYPVMYMFDGHNMFRDDWATYGKSWGLTKFLNAWDMPMIVVGVDCDPVGNGRLIEYAPYEMEIPPCGMIDGHGEETMEWIIEELKPFIDDHYPTIPFREATGIGGSSMGGLMSLYAISKYNLWFSKAACLSPSVRFCYGQILEEVVRAEMDEDTRVYISWGSKESRTKSALAVATDRNLTLNQALARKGVSTYPYLHLNGAHCEAAWEEEVPRFMDYLWK